MGLIFPGQLKRLKPVSDWYRLVVFSYQLSRDARGKKSFMLLLFLQEHLNLFKALQSLLNFQVFKNWTDNVSVVCFLETNNVFTHFKIVPHYKFEKMWKMGSSAIIRDAPYTFRVCYGSRSSAFDGQLNSQWLYLLRELERNTVALC